MKYLAFIFMFSTSVYANKTGYLGWKDPTNKLKVKYQGTPVIDSWLPESFDWRGSGFLVPIKNQGSCGSCWAFAIVKSLEISEHIYGNRDKQDLSEQQMVSCERSAYGCSGGFMESAIFVVNKGIAQESEFPYKGSNLNCKQGLPIAAKATSFTLLGSPNKKPEVGAIKSAIIRYGSVFVTVAAGGSGWSKAGDSVTVCRNRGTNHMVNIVGWTSSNEWIMANSWGSDWKDGGYAKVPFGCDSIAQEAGYIEVE